jgi:hypothetical protein
MKGDFTRGFNPDTKRGERYRRVLLQQGRALLDSDIAALVDAADDNLRDSLRMTACHAGSSDLGFLVTPGRLLAQFDASLGNAYAVAGGAEAVRDYSRKYLETLPGLRIGGPGGTVTVSLDAPLVVATAIRLWVRADNGGASASVNGTVIALPAGAEYQPVDVTTSGVQLVFAVDPGARYWIAMIETRADAGVTPVLHSAAGAYEIDGLVFATEGGVWPGLPDPAGAAYAGQADSPPNTRLVAYLEAYERHITAVDDPGILEEALGGDVDTTTRTRVAFQVKLAQVSGLAPAAIAEAFASVNLPGGTLLLGVANETVTPDPCDLPVPGGYTGPENRLYRIEVHGPVSGGTLFKWSRENGSELFPAGFPDTLVIGNPAASLVVQAEADLRDGDLVELLSDAIELGDSSPGTLGPGGFQRPLRAPGRLLRLSGGEEVTGSTRIFDLLDPIDETPVADIDSGRFGAEGLKLRRWSGLIIHTADGLHDLEHGIQADIAGDFEPGDWWQYEARTGSANANGPSQSSPHGPERLFAPLALLRQTAAGQPMLLEAWLDSRFPRLCEIEADDVSYDGDRVGTDADTVQEALDELFERETGGCGEIAVPIDADIRDSIDAIPNGGDAKLCLGPGSRTIPSVIRVENKGHVTITGIGLGTLLEAQRPVFLFRNCRAVTLLDISFHATGVGRNIVLIQDCGEVDLQRLVLRSDAPVEHGAAALRIEATQDGSIRRARVHACRMSLGLNDTGVLSMGVLDLAVTDCRIEVRDAPFDLVAAMADNAFATTVGRVFLSQLSFNVDTNIFVGGSDVEYDTGERGRHGVALAGWGRDPLRFSTHAAMSSRHWDLIAQANPAQIDPSTQQHMRALIRRVRRGIARFALGQAAGNVSVPTRVRGILQLVGQAISGSAPNVYGHAGVVVAAPRGPLRPIDADPSSAATEPDVQSVRINGNRIRGFHQGIRVGASSSRTGGPQNRVSVFADVEVDGNRIDLFVPMYVRSRWGIFVGNAVSVGVRNNRVARIYDGPSEDIPNPLSPTDGIRVWGHFGLFVQIERNACINTTHGVRFHPITAPNYPNTTHVWKVHDLANNEPIPTNAYSGNGGQAEIVEIPTPN